MKKIIALILCIVTICCLFTGCLSKEEKARARQMEADTAEILKDYLKTRDVKFKIKETKARTDSMDTFVWLTGVTRSTVLLNGQEHYFYVDTNDNNKIYSDEGVDVFHENVLNSILGQANLPRPREYKIQLYNSTIGEYDAIEVDTDIPSVLEEPYSCIAELRYQPGVLSGFEDMNHPISLQGNYDVIITEAEDGYDPDVLYSNAIYMNWQYSAKFDNSGLVEDHLTKYQRKTVNGTTFATDAEYDVFDVEALQIKSSTQPVTTYYPGYVFTPTGEGYDININHIKNPFDTETHHLYIVNSKENEGYYANMEETGEMDEIHAFGSHEPFCVLRYWLKSDSFNSSYVIYSGKK